MSSMNLTDWAKKLLHLTWKIDDPAKQHIKKP
jgi:hypothetical protein